MTVHLNGLVRVAKAALHHYEYSVNASAVEIDQALQDALGNVSRHARAAIDVAEACLFASEEGAGAEGIQMPVPGLLDALEANSAAYVDQARTAWAKAAQQLRGR